MVSPGTATTRFTSRTPSCGEKKTTISPRDGLSHSPRRWRVKGTLRSYASLFTNTKSPSRIVGFIEPVGTQFQSATADFKGKTMMAANPRGLSHSLHKYFMAFCKRFGTRMSIRPHQHGNV